MAVGSPSGKRRRRMRTLSPSWTGPRMMPVWQGNWLPSACWSRRPCRFKLAPTLVFSRRQSRPSAGPRWWGESMEDESFWILELNTLPQTVVVILSLSSNLLGPSCSPEWVAGHQEGYREGNFCQRAAREWNHGKASGPDDVQQSCKALLPAGWKTSEQKKQPGMAHPPLGGQGRSHWSSGSPAGFFSDFVLVSGLHWSSAEFASPVWFSLWSYCRILVYVRELGQKGLTQNTLFFT